MKYTKKYGVMSLLMVLLFGQNLQARATLKDFLDKNIDIPKTEQEEKADKEYLQRATQEGIAHRKYVTFMSGAATFLGTGAIAMAQGLFQDNGFKQLCAATVASLLMRKFVYSLSKPKTPTVSPFSKTTLDLREMQKYLGNGNFEFIIDIEKSDSTDFIQQAAAGIYNPYPHLYVIKLLKEAISTLKNFKKSCDTILTKSLPSDFKNVLIKYQNLAEKELNKAQQYLLYANSLPQVSTELTRQKEDELHKARLEKERSEAALVQAKTREAEAKESAAKAEARANQAKAVASTAAAQESAANALKAQAEAKKAEAEAAKIKKEKELLDKKANTRDADTQTINPPAVPYAAERPAPYAPGYNLQGQPIPSAPPAHEYPNYPPPAYTPANDPVK